LWEVGIGVSLAFGLDELREGESFFENSFAGLAELHRAGRVQVWSYFHLVARAMRRGQKMESIDWAGSFESRWRASAAESVATVPLLPSSVFALFGPGTGGVFGVLTIGRSSCFSIRLHASESEG
jgi:hypothetical protein